MDFITLLIFHSEPFPILCWTLSGPFLNTLKCERIMTDTRETEGKLFFRARTRQKISSLMESDPEGSIHTVSYWARLHSISRHMEGFQCLLSIEHGGELSQTCSFQDLPSASESQLTFGS